MTDEPSEELKEHLHLLLHALGETVYTLRQLGVALGPILEEVAKAVEAADGEAVRYAVIDPEDTTHG